MDKGTLQQTILLSMIPLGAILFRIRGGWLNLPSTTVGRMVWSVGMTVLPVAATMNWWLLLLAPALFLGCILPWWKSIDMGRNEGRLIIDAALQTARGILWVLPAVALLYWQYEWAALAALIPGLLCAAAYEAGWRIPSEVPHFSRGAELGEVIFGAMIGAGLASAIIAGA
jgi:hypothetical protein